MKLEYKKALIDDSHIAYLVFDGETFAGSGGVSFFVMPTYHNTSGKKAYIMNMYTVPKYSSHIAYLVFDGETFAGSGGVSFFVMPTYHNTSGKKAYIMNMYTVPKYRRRGMRIKPWINW